MAHGDCWCSYTVGKVESVGHRVKGRSEQDRACRIVPLCLVCFVTRACVSSLSQSHHFSNLHLRTSTCLAARAKQPRYRNTFIHFSAEVAATQGCTQTMTLCLRLGFSHFHSELCAVLMFFHVGPIAPAWSRVIETPSFEPLSMVTTL